MYCFLQSYLKVVCQLNKEVVQEIGKHVNNSKGKSEGELGCRSGKHLVPMEQKNEGLQETGVGVKE